MCHHDASEYDRLPLAGGNIQRCYKHAVWGGSLKVSSQTCDVQQGGLRPRLLDTHPALPLTILGKELSTQPESNWPGACYEPQSLA